MSFSTVKGSGHLFRLGPEAAEALAEERPVVALESTLIAQGLPWPENLETARAAEKAVRDCGSVPATVAILGGVPCIGLTADELERIAKPSGKYFKANRRDIAYAIARGLDAATTVSATLFLARTAGITVLATGGIGGVHRGAPESFDISSDIDELGQASGAAVVCSGVKSILDVPATLELLETRGVPILGYRTGEFPGFTSVTSGLSLETRVDSPAEAAKVIVAHRELGIPGAVLLTQPVPASVALDRSLMETALSSALADARRQNLAGKAITPFLLEKLRLATNGRSLAANTALILANAQLAAALAASLSGLEPVAGPQK